MATSRRPYSTTSINWSLPLSALCANFHREGVRRNA
jgi:hypothetical protein